MFMDDIAESFLLGCNLEQIVDRVYSKHLQELKVK